MKFRGFLFLFLGGYLLSCQSQSPKKSISTSDSCSLHFIEPEKSSLASNLMVDLAEKTRVDLLFEKILRKQMAPEKAVSPMLHFKLKYQLNDTSFQNRKLWILEPKTKTPSQKTVIYLHGGGYVANLLPMHWEFIEQYIDLTGNRVIVPDYPLAPDFTQRQVEVYMKLLMTWIYATYPDAQIILMGDSAGGGLALSTAILVKGKGLHELILLSPWLDASMNNKRILTDSVSDPILSLPTLKLAATAYSGSDTLNHPFMCPLPWLQSQTDLSYLPPMKVFIGGRDIFRSDALTLKDYLISKNRCIQLYEFPDMLHVWMLNVRLPESKKVLSLVSGNQ
jgi:acetyl esterase/lipase